MVSMTALSTAGRPRAVVMVWMKLSSGSDLSCSGRWRSSATSRPRVISCRARTPRVSNALARDSRWQAATVSARIEHPGADQLIAEMATQLRLHRVGTDSRTHRSYAAIAVGLPWPSRK
jgi:hypothetical protein